MGLCYVLKAKNNNQEVQLYIDKDNTTGEFWFTLTGKYKGDNIQIDFDDISGEELEEFVDFLSMKLHKSKYVKDLEKARERFDASMEYSAVGCDIPNI